MENPNVQYYQIKSSTYDSNKFKYSIVDIQMENISEMIKDECIKDAIILEPEQYKNKYDEEKQQLLNDLALLENTSEIVN